MENKYLKAIEALGEMISLKEQTIKYQSYEIEELKERINTILKKYEK